MKPPVTVALLVAVPCAIASALAAPSDYPTAALAEYVVLCMTGKEPTREILERCACSVDVVASIMPYDKYVQAETALRMSQVPGENTAMFRDVPWIQDVVDELEGAQSQARTRCF